MGAVIILRPWDMLVLPESSKDKAAGRDWARASSAPTVDAFQAGRGAVEQIVQDCARCGHESSLLYIQTYRSSRFDDMKAHSTSYHYSSLSHDVHICPDHLYCHHVVQLLLPVCSPSQPHPKQSTPIPCIYIAITCRLIIHAKCPVLDLLSSEKTIVVLCKNPEDMYRKEKQEE
jgi:hypothetical protein